MCGIIGVIDKRRQCVDGGSIRNSLALMDERGNGEGAGYVAYGIYPDFADSYALHVFFDKVHENKPALDKMLEERGTIVCAQLEPGNTKRTKLQFANLDPPVMGDSLTRVAEKARSAFGPAAGGQETYRVLGFRS